jgi:hypothetical protein
MNSLMMPKAYTSTAGLSRPNLSSSGAEWLIVPQLSVVWCVLWRDRHLLRPRSATLAHMSTPSELLQLLTNTLREFCGRATHKTNAPRSCDTGAHTRTSTANPQKPGGPRGKGLLSTA